MHYHRYFTASLLTAMMAFAACENGPAPALPGKGPVTLEVIAERPDPVDEETRVTLSDGQLVWEGDETLGVLFSNSQDTEGGPRAILKSISGGRFAGKIDLNAYGFQGRTMSDLRAIVSPADRNSRFECNSAGNRVATPIASHQVQHRNGVLNGEYIPLYATVSQNDLKPMDDGRYTLEGIQLKYGCTLLEYNVYGDHPDAKST